MADFQDVFCRVEKKYLMDAAQYQFLLEKLQARGFEIDQFGLHTISNLYYDTQDFALIRHSLEKPVYKEKLRLRGYGSVQKDSTAFLEIKKKFKGIVYKRRVALPLNEAEQAVAQGKMPPGLSQIGREIDWFLHFYSVEPKVMLAYDREALFSKDDQAVRVTFDRNIRFRDTALDLSLGAAGTPILSPEQFLMEVKLPMANPLWLCRLLEEAGVRQASFSKYGACYTRFLSQKNREEKFSA